MVYRFLEKPHKDKFLNLSMQEGEAPSCPLPRLVYPIGRTGRHRPHSSLLFKDLLQFSVDLLAMQVLGKTLRPDTPSCGRDFLLIKLIIEELIHIFMLPMLH